MATHDEKTTMELWPIALNQIEIGLARCDHQRLVLDSEDWWSFIDWHKKLNKQSASQGVLIYCLEKAIRLAQFCQPEISPKLQETLIHLKKAANTLWDPLSGVNSLFLTIGAVILSIGAGQRLAIYFSMQADLVDYGVWKTRINTAGIFTSINGFLGKVTMAGAGAITGFLPSSGGYVANSVQSPSALFAIKLCCLYLPALLIIAFMFWIGKFYKLDDNYSLI